MKSFKKVKNAAAIINCLVAISTIGSLGFNNISQAAGPSDGGGGSTINGVTLDSYLAKQKIDSSKLKSKVDSQIKALAEKSPEFAAELQRAFKDLDWYMIDRPLNQLPFSRTKIPFAIKQIAIQIEDNVFFEKKELEQLAKKKGEQEKMILHELMRRIFLQAEGTNVQVTEGSVYKATDLIANVEKMPAKELNEKLEALGFQTKNIKYSKRKGEPKREIASMPDPVSVQVNLKNPITIESAREVSLECMAADKSNDSLLYEMVDKITGDATKYAFPGAKEDKSIFLPIKVPAENERFAPAEAIPSIQPRLSHIAGYSLSFAALCRVHMIQSVAGSKLETGFSFTLDSMHGDTLKMCTSKTPISNISLNIDGGLPSIEYSGATNEPVYTPMGLTNTQQHIESIAIVANRNWVEGDGMVSLQNAVTGVTLPAEYKIDGKKYVNCLKDGFEKKSQQAQKQSSEQGNEALNPDVITSKAVTAKVKVSSDALKSSSGAEKQDASSTE